MKCRMRYIKIIDNTIRTLVWFQPDRNFRQEINKPIMPTKI